jgi:hypothetical protein
MLQDTEAETTNGAQAPWWPFFKNLKTTLNVLKKLERKF